MRDPFAIFSCIFSSRATKSALIVLVLGWLPLLLVGAFGAADANPVGLGLLAWFSIPVAFLLGCVGIVRGVRRWLAG